MLIVIGILPLLLCIASMLSTVVNEAPYYDSNRAMLLLGVQPIITAIYYLCFLTKLIFSIHWLSLAAPIG